MYSRVHISSDEVFSKILKKPSIVQKKIIPHIRQPLVFLIRSNFFSNENQLGFHMRYVSFFPALWMVPSESWKRRHPN